MTREFIIAQVRARIDEITTPEDIDLTGDVFAVIDENLEDSANDLCLKAPLWMCPTSEMVKNQHQESSGSGTISLPEDFLRLHSFKMKEWNHPVSTPIAEDHPLYKFQKNEFLRGTPYKPIVVIVNNGNRRKLEYYSVKADHTIDKALYIKAFSKDNNDATNITQDLMTGFLWQCAANFFTIVQQPNLAQAAISKLTDFIILNSHGTQPQPQKE